MSELTGVMQILLYTDTTRYEDMDSFYRDLLLEDPYYSWYESESDRGAKFRIGSSMIDVLCQEKNGPDQLSIFQLEAENVDEMFERVYAKCPECIFEKISTRPYGTRFFSILDPMGNKVSIYMNGH